MNNSAISDQELQEFRQEATELLDQAESSLLAIDRGGNFGELYDAVFRVFHSLKGAAGMLGLAALQKHMHSLEGAFSTTKVRQKLQKNETSFFLNGVDAARKILEGKSIHFIYDFPPKADSQNSPQTLKKHDPKTTPTKPAIVKGLAYCVDDEEDILELLTEILSPAGIEAVTFTDPEALLKKTRTNPPDFIITDLKMPQMSGLDLLRSLRSLNVRVPVIIVSGFVTTEALINALESGIFAAIEKPFNPSVLLSYASAALNQQRLLKMFQKSFNLLLYQFTDLDEFLTSNGRADVAKTIRNELKLLNTQWRSLLSSASQKKQVT